MVTMESLYFRNDEDFDTYVNKTIKSRIDEYINFYTLSKDNINLHFDYNVINTKRKELVEIVSKFTNKKIINTGYVDVFLNGIRLDETNYSITGTGVSLGVGAYDQDEITIVGFNTLNAGGASSQTLDQTLSFGNSSSLGMSIGIITATDYRIQSVAEKTTLVNGNTVSLVYNTGGGNVAICTNPSGNITLNVTGIPTDSSFNNYSLAFSVIVTNTGTARSCTAINLNGVSESILWFGGSLAAAISGVTTSNGYDVYSFTGINTVGSASTTSNYVVLGSVNGSYR
jgi:hypothetical protein